WLNAFPQLFLPSLSNESRLRFVLICTSEFTNTEDRAEVISKDCAIQEILKSDNSDELLEKYGLKKLADKSLIAEAE
ncbi:unnamed protein product, partial [marine sediment metagenome]